MKKIPEDNTQIYNESPNNTAAIERFRRDQLNRQSTLDNLDAASGGSTRLTGELLLIGSGEKRVPVVFSAPFTEKPLMTFGAEIQSGDLMTEGQFPTISAIVSKWITFDRPPSSRLFTGCELAIVTTGPATQKMIVYWCMDGPTITNFGIY